MKKFLLNTLLVTFVIVGFTGQSWAFASRHHGGGQNNGSQGGSSSSNNPGNGSNPSGDNGPTGANSSNPGSGSSGSGNPGYNPDPIGPPEKNFPAAPVPEPMTLSLLGTGLAGIFLKRKMR